MEQSNQLPEEVRAFIGREQPPVTGDPVLFRDIHRFALAIGDPNPIYHDPEAAKRSKHGAVVAPPCYVVWATNPAVSNRPPQEMREDGAGAPTTTDPLASVRARFPRSVRAGDEYEFHAPIKVGDQITAHRRIADIYQRQGRTGPMVFTVTETRYTNQRGELVAVHRANVIAR